MASQVPALHEDIHVHQSAGGARVESGILALPYRITWHWYQVCLALPLVTAFVILLLTLFDPAARNEILSARGLLSTGVALFVGFVGTWLVVSRHTLSVSSDGLWMGTKCVPWQNVVRVRYSRIKLPSVNVYRSGQWWPVIGIPRRSIPEIEAYIGRVRSL